MVEYVRENRPHLHRDPATEEVKTAQVLTVANHLYKGRDYVFMRFERLAVLNVLHWQHKLVLLDEKLRIRKMADKEPVEWNDADADHLTELLAKYDSSLGILHATVSRYRNPDSIRTREFGLMFTRAFDEPRYRDSEDALNLYDLQPRSERATADSLRQFLQRYAPASMLDMAGRDERLLKTRAKAGLLTPGDRKILENRKHSLAQTSPVVDRLARVFMGVLGGILLLGPMVALSLLSELKSKIWPLVATSLFVTAFSVLLALTTRATNQELVAATAAYSAVLVVFVGLS